MHRRTRRLRRIEARDRRHHRGGDARRAGFRGGAQLAGGVAEGARRRRGGRTNERVRLMPGARELVRTMRGWGATAVLVSGGFTSPEPVAAEIGFDRAIANVLEVADGRLAGTAAKPIVGAATKKATLLDYRANLGLSDAATLAVGDGANDLAMIEVAGLGVAYRAKPIVAAAAMAQIEHGDLTALYWAQGVPKAEWVE
ncbi:HAD-IB family phosphatase [Sphingomonas sp. MMS24-JH45]